jgi:drug/metabolite transporter (DMT)-like permease
MSVFYLLMSILCSSLINVVFKYIGIKQISTLQAIVVNYVICFAVGLLFSGNYALIEHTESAWFWSCMALGILFVIIFFAMGLTTSKLGISVNAVSSKMAVVVPLTYAVLILKEEIHWYFYVGLVLSLLSILLITSKPSKMRVRGFFYLPLIVFLGSGIIDTTLKLFQEQYAASVDASVISYSIFLGAFIAGMMAFLFQSKFNLKHFKRKSILAGILLGVPNYFSIYFLIKSIEAFAAKSALVFSINNVSIVLLSTVLGVYIFKEHLSTANKWGLVTAVISIVLLSYA